RDVAARRLAVFTSHEIESHDRLPSGTLDKRFDLILSNHVLYYVDDLDSALEGMKTALAPGGKLLLAIAGWENALMRLWKTGFALAGRPVPYHGADEVAES